jgi:hypothetical protein
VSGAVRVAARVLEPLEPERLQTISIVQAD